MKLANITKMFSIHTVLMLVVLFFALYFIHKIYVSETSIMEGLTNKDVLQDAIKELNKDSDKVDRDIAVTDNKSAWEDYIIAYDKLIDMTILQQIKDAGNIFTNNEANSKKIGFLNDLYTLKQNLNSSMDFLDKSSSATSSFF